MTYMKNMVGRSLLILSSFLSCAAPLNRNPHLAYVKNTETPIRWCDVPQFVITHPSIPEDKRDPVAKAVEYWDEVTEPDLFLFIGLLDMPPSRAGIVVMEMPEPLSETLDNHVCAQTVVRSDILGCIRQSVVYVEKRCFGQPNDIFETVIRHELGHAVGMVHSSSFTDLMAPNIEWTMQHPVDLSEEELRAIHSLY